MARVTSKQAYEAISIEGIKQTLQEAILSVLTTAKKPMTTHEIRFALKSSQRDSISPRMAELKQLGDVAEIGIKRCNITGRNAIAYGLAPRGTKPLPLPPTRTELISMLYNAANILGSPHSSVASQQQLSQKIKRALAGEQLRRKLPKID